MTKSRRILSLCVALSLGFVQSVQAVELISAEQVVQREQQGGEARERLASVMARSDVAAALAERGVTAEQARERVAALTDAEAAWLLAEIDRAPAGATAGELLGTVILVLMVLMFSDILGFTHIFPFLHKAR